ncbi:Uncharacterized protein APZ42_015965 [Daphnia magna]|uniref:Uncharacterized protein n=1 Tax=Daphnia magna TaxID=35525 RepID=A0A162NH07_9CRUS|nr:Uncharacterized protein APZ42_015965 [Daphnia magna]
MPLPNNNVYEMRNVLIIGTKTYMVASRISLGSKDYVEKISFMPFKKSFLLDDLSCHVKRLYCSDFFIRVISLQYLL